MQLKRGVDWIRVPTPHGWRVDDEFDTPNYGRFRIIGILDGGPMTPEDAHKWGIVYDSRRSMETLFIEPVPAAYSPSRSRRYSSSQSSS